MSALITLYGGQLSTRLIKPNYLDPHSIDTPFLMRLPWSSVLNSLIKGTPKNKVIIMIKTLIQEMEIFAFLPKAKQKEGSRDNFSDSSIFLLTASR